LLCSYRSLLLLRAADCGNSRQQTTRDPCYRRTWNAAGRVR
jgi:hypothetical protein